MTDPTASIDFVVKPIQSDTGPMEFQQSMTPHPMVHQELAHDPHFGIYNRRLRSLAYGKVNAEDIYWRLRRECVLAHTGELATEIRGPDAEAMLDRVFTRDISKQRVGRCSYQLACFADGGLLMDGVLMRLAQDRFWYVQGDGEFRVWLRAQSEGFDVNIVTADAWISQVQGPLSLEVLAEVADDGMPEPFRYFDLAQIRIGGQPVLISRTGYTNELGWEFYFGSDADANAVGDRLLAAGRPYGMHTIPAAATNIRRIEAGLLFTGTDFDETVTPFAAGLGAFVQLDKGHFIGRDALARADQRCRTWGLKCPNGVPRRGEALSMDDVHAGRVCSSAWSPFLRQGVAIVRLNQAEFGPGTLLEVECTDGRTRPAAVCELPMYDRAREIPRGKRIDVPELPTAW